MTRLPRLTGRRVLSALTKAGFDVYASKHFLRHSDGRTTVVPIHRGETIGPGLLSKILHDCELTVDEFQALL
jgi:predicted RNA binding protein YcfA (HicA-like mRNA interferase family)